MKLPAHCATANLKCSLNNDSSSSHSRPIWLYELTLRILLLMTTPLLSYPIRRGYVIWKEGVILGVGAVSLNLRGNMVVWQHCLTSNLYTLNYR